MVKFRRAKKFGPARITISNRGLGISAGSGPVRVGLGADGKVRRTVRIPGTGISSTKVISENGKKQRAQKVQATAPQQAPSPRRVEHSNRRRREVAASPQAQRRDQYLLAMGFAVVTFMLGVITQTLWLSALSVAAIALGVASIVTDRAIEVTARSTLDDHQCPVVTGWYPDPLDSSKERFSDGGAWTGLTRTARI